MGSPSRYFDIFGLKPSFAIDQNVLKERYYKMSRKFHPDKASPSGEDISMEEINKAYDTLKNDLSRARYLNNPGNIDVGKEFLIDVLDYEQAISNAKNNEDRNRIKEDLEKKIDQCKRNPSGEYLARWGYYARLMKMLNKR
ncbi:HscB-like chaperone [Encephalitozoon intestinalis ATCC 50506]|uniref:HscB-like chaperone n=1 Tax=Encephalitozoon intestinalis (strain ATCC 50506) TaxID=876142 RepID=E0S5S8_ENCIT|nr:HscB-like chaperone [Encephalitozoon intestinalis ATCC 50506]ADM11063.1 HscB-like chaperone [Encephalitozoon intestinalis ATCC 50506]UTX44713.1 HscB-like chaperone [Encephalitozoon intestinalis]